MKISKVHAAVIAALTGASGVWFQTASAQQEASGLEEIVVTATRRSENLQEVPISIVAITGDGLQMRGLQNIENLNATIPNLSVMGSAGGGGTAATSFRVRGIPNVGTYVDGVWQISTAGFLTEEFVDLDRVEVLRGPQGTLFGRDSVGGALRIFTKRPTDEFGGTFKGTVGTYNRHDATISANLPFSDNVKSKWTFASLNRDGYITSLTTGLKGGNIGQSDVRGDIVWTPTDKLDIRSQFSRQTSEFIEPRVEDAVWISSGFNPTATAALLYTYAGLPFDQNSQMAGWPGGTVGKWENRSEITIPNEITTDRASFDVKLALTDKLSVDFLTGYTNQRTKIWVDYDNSQYALVEDLGNGHNHMFSQEIQFSGGGDRVQWVAGAFYWDESTRSRNVRYAMQEFTDNPLTMADNQLALDLYATPYCQNLQALAATNSLPPGGTTCEAGMKQYKTNSWVSRFGGIGGTLAENGTSGVALFGEVTLLLTDKLTLTLGAREHSQDNYSQTMTPINAAPRYSNQNFAADPLAGYLTPAQQAARNVALNSFDKATGRVSVKYQFTSNVMGYASFSQGFNSGNASYVTNPETGIAALYPTKPETLNNFEVGMRSDLANGKVRFNATLFDTKWDDIVINTALRICDPNCRDLTAVYPQNVGSAHARGAEFELTLAPTNNLLFNVNLGLLDTGYDKITAPSIVAYVPGQTEFSQAPDKTINIGIQHDASLTKGGSLVTRFDYTYVSQYWRSPDPTLRVVYYPGIPTDFSDESGDFGQFNARLTYAPASSKWDWSLFGTNLTNEYQLNSGFFHGVWGYDFSTVARPREIGTSITFHF
jgi:iron complex outermembrane receptor protein